jgi:predicted transcriptional regulator
LSGLIQRQSVNMKYKIEDLAAANVNVVSVHPDSSLTEATTKMLLNDFSQLPVMSSPRKLEGVVSWKTIGISESFGSNNQVVRNCMDKNVAVLKSSDNLFDSVRTILDKEYAFIKNHEEIVTGIVTIYDIAFQFNTLSEPFIQLELIETSIRRFIDNHLNKEVFTGFCKEKYPERKIESSSDLTFGEYIGIIENRELWSYFTINLDRKAFIEKLECIRLIRNEIMHFRLKEISNTHLKALKDVSKFFRMLERVS